MKDSQLRVIHARARIKYIKESNERFSTLEHNKDLYD